ncbi:DUF6596 domain-containing protein [Actinomadura madurae]|nr:DUF6596 domain-containing protein [Actinomadura madurae]
MPDEPEVLGLLALMLLVESRKAARLHGGELVLLGEQDRGVVGSRSCGGGAGACQAVPGDRPAGALPDSGGH